MLVLKRHVNEWIVIEHMGQKLRICLTDVCQLGPRNGTQHNGFARLGFDGSEDFLVLREELDQQEWRREPSGHGNDR